MRTKSKSLSLAGLLCAACASASADRVVQDEAGSARPDAGSQFAAEDSGSEPSALAPDAATPVLLPWSQLACDHEVDALDEPMTASELVTPRGAVLRCARADALTASEVDALARSAGYVGPALRSGAKLVTIAYRTERGSEPPLPGFSLATVLLPDAPRAKLLPVLVVAHGTMGQGPACPISREPVRESGTYLAELGFPLVGAGYAVVLPDYAGYAAFGAPGNPPSGYLAALDEAKSVLDGARALRRLVPAAFATELVLVGHSQGGHAVLSALALHASYGSDSTLTGVVAYAPAWFPITSFGGMLALPGDYMLPAQAGAVAGSVWYHYSQAELLDGPGEGARLFAAERRDAITAFFRDHCDPAGIAAIGPDIGALFDPSFSADVAYFAGANLPCLSERCRRWMGRYRADRPHLTGEARSVPILLVHGDRDDSIPPERAACGFDRLERDGAALSICIVAGEGHNSVVGARADQVNAWIAARTLGAPEPGPCGAPRSELRTATGSSASCALLPPND